MARASGVSRRAIAVGLAELKQKPEETVNPEGAVRRKGAGRKKTLTKDPALLQDLENLVNPVTRGDPQSPLQWTCKSVRNLAEALRRKGHNVSHVLVAEMLHQQNYSLQANRKTKEGSSPKQRNSSISGNRLSRWTPRKKNRWGTTRMVAGNGGQRGSQNPCRYTISPNRKMPPMGSTIWGRTQVG